MTIRGILIGISYEPALLILLQFIMFCFASSNFAAEKNSFVNACIIHDEPIGKRILVKSFFLVQPLLAVLRVTPD